MWSQMCQKKADVSTKLILEKVQKLKKKIKTNKHKSVHNLRLIIGTKQVIFVNFSIFSFLFFLFQALKCLATCVNCFTKCLTAKFTPFKAKFQSFQKFFLFKLKLCFQCQAFKNIQLKFVFKKYTRAIRFQKLMTRNKHLI